MANQRTAGFTTIELVVVILLLGIMAVAVIPKMADRSVFEEMGFRGQVLATLRHARKTAIASRRHVCVAIDGTGVTLTLDPRVPENLTGAVDCTSNLSVPGGCSGAANKVCTPSGVALSAVPGSFAYDPLGRSTAAATVTVSGQPAITVEQETGYVY